MVDTASPSSGSLGRRKLQEVQQKDSDEKQGQEIESSSSKLSDSKQQLQQAQQRVRQLRKSSSGPLNEKKNTASTAVKRRLFICLLLLLVGLVWMVLLPQIDFSDQASSHNNQFISPHREHFRRESFSSSASRPGRRSVNKRLKRMPLGFQQVLKRSRQTQQHCQNIHAGFDNRNELDTEYLELTNMTTSRLRSFGFINALEDYYGLNNATNATTSKWEKYEECVLPPEEECQETQLTAIFMAYNPDRLFKTFKHMKVMMEDTKYKQLVAEVVLVWNGPRAVNESNAGQKLLEYANNENNPLRVVYPLKQGLPNDLMNRYHPDIVKVTKTKGILFYDDDGPFYDYEAVLAGFELWKRNANAQMGAMSRNIRLNKRQEEEKQSIITESSNAATSSPHYHDTHRDRFFVSHCPAANTNEATDDAIVSGDQVQYNYNVMPNFGANMVLPSGSMLHVNYLCFIWHPALQPVRQFVLDHPVHPDDMTVSMIVSQVSGRAPRVYSRRLNKAKSEETTKALQENKAVSIDTKRHRRLLFDLNWDAGHGMTDAKEKWAELRKGAVNSLVRFFGNINSGSIGWCYGTKFYNEKKRDCNPEFAKIGYYPWMTLENRPKQTCP